MTKKSLNLALREAYEQAELEGHSEKITVGPVSDFDPEEFLDPEEPFSFEEGNVVIYQFPTLMHDYVSSEVGNFIATGLNQSVSSAAGQRQAFTHTSVHIKGISDVFNCSTNKGKIPDALVRDRLNVPAKIRRPGPIAVEVAFRHEDFVKLLHEGCHLLSANTDIEYVFLIYMIENYTQSDVDGVRIIVLQRSKPLCTDLLKSPSLDCLKSPWPLKTEQALISTQDLMRLPALVVYDRTTFRTNVQSVDDAIVLSLREINDWYGADRFDQRFLRLSGRDLAEVIFSQIDMIISQNQYSIGRGNLKTEILIADVNK